MCSTYSCRGVECKKPRVMTFSVITIPVLTGRGGRVGGRGSGARGLSSPTNGFVRLPETFIDAKMVWLSYERWIASPIPTPRRRDAAPSTVRPRQRPPHPRPPQQQLHARSPPCLHQREWWPRRRLVVDRFAPRTSSASDRTTRARGASKTPAGPGRAAHLLTGCSICRL